MRHKKDLSRNEGEEEEEEEEEGSEDLFSDLNLSGGAAGRSSKAFQHHRSNRR